MPSMVSSLCIAVAPLVCFSHFMIDEMSLSILNLEIKRDDLDVLMIHVHHGYMIDHYSKNQVSTRWYSMHAGAIHG